jgi:hypothetical protein
VSRLCPNRTSEHMREACGALQGSWPLGDGKSPGGLLQVRKVVVSLVVPVRAPRRLVTPGSIVRVAQRQSGGLTTPDAGSNPAADFCKVIPSGRARSGRVLSGRVLSSHVHLFFSRSSL